MTDSKQFEAQPATKPAHESSEPSPLVKFSVHYNSEPRQGPSEASRSAEKSKIPPEKLFLDRLSQVSLLSDKKSLNADGQAKVAWDKLFQPTGFSEKKAAKEEEESLCLAKNIYS